MKRLIPTSREEDVIHLYWQLLGALESRCRPEDVLDKHLVTAGYNVLNQIGYTDARPQWERAKAS